MKTRTLHLSTGTIQESESLGRMKWGLVVVGEAVGLVGVVLIGVRTEGHFGWTSNPNWQLNWHPLLAAIGPIFICANSILTYRYLRRTKEMLGRIIHAGLQTLVLILLVISLVAAFDFHNYRAFTNMTTLHSWIGIVSVALFAIQWACGVLSLHPGIPSSIQEKIAPYHTYLGLTTFLWFAIAAITGLVEMGGSSITPISGITKEAALMNVTGLLFLLFTMFVFYVATVDRT